MPTASEENKDAILEDLKGILKEEEGIDPETVTPEKSFTDDLKIDSLAMMSIVVAIEEKFSVKVEDDDVAKIATVQNAVDFIYTAQNPE